MKTSHFFYPMILLILSYGCNTESTYFFIESQSKTIDSYRRQGFYEYASPLNNEMWNILKAKESNFYSNEIIQTIEKVKDKVAKEKNEFGCYIIPWSENRTDSISNGIIMLEWNQNAEVIKRIFTKSEIIKENLPSQSF